MNDILTDSEAAELLGCDVSTVQAEARAHKLPAIKPGKSWRFPRLALIEHANAQARLHLERAGEAKPKAVKVAPVRPQLVGL